MAETENNGREDEGEDEVAERASILPREGAGVGARVVGAGGADAYGRATGR